MKPKPFSPLNHFTEPVAIENPLLPWPDLTPFPGGHGRCDSLESEGFPICTGGALGENSSALDCAIACLMHICPISGTPRGRRSGPQTSPEAGSRARPSASPRAADKPVV